MLSPKNSAAPNTPRPASTNLIRACDLLPDLADLRDQRHDPALPVVVGPHHQADVLDGDDQRHRPEDQRDDAVDALERGLDRMRVTRVERDLNRVDRAGADVPEDHSERPHDERRSWPERALRRRPRGNLCRPGDACANREVTGRSVSAMSLAAARRISFRSSGLTPMAGRWTSTSTVPAARSTTRTAPSRSSRSIISSVFDEHERRECVDALLARAHRDPFQQQRAEPSTLPVVDHGHRHLGRVGPRRVAHVAGDADSLVVLLVERDQRLVVAVIDLD